MIFSHDLWRTLFKSQQLYKVISSFYSNRIVSYRDWFIGAMFKIIDVDRINYIEKKLSALPVKSQTSHIVNCCWWLWNVLSGVSGQTMSTDADTFHFWHAHHTRPTFTTHTAGAASGAESINSPDHSQPTNKLAKNTLTRIPQRLMQISRGALSVLSRKSIVSLPHSHLIYY